MYVRHAVWLDPFGLVDVWKLTGLSSTLGRNNKSDYKFKAICPLAGTLLCVCEGTNGIYARIISLLCS
jgi:hypothetical protein